LIAIAGTAWFMFTRPILRAPAVQAPGIADAG
jgi:hypothetical protein